MTGLCTLETQKYDEATSVILRRVPYVHFASPAAKHVCKSIGHQGGNMKDDVSTMNRRNVRNPREKGRARSQISKKK